MSDDELRLNRLHRYSKTSGRLALEVHSHCEVPAGCGGVVLRWRQADAPAGITASFYFAPAGAEPWLTLDGEPLERGRARIAQGRHVLAFSTTVAVPSEGFFVGAVRFEPSIGSSLAPVFSTSMWAAWRATRAPQTDDAWRSAGFDDAKFEPLVTRAVPKPAGRQTFQWEYLSRDSTGLALPETLAKGTGPVFVRGVFQLTPRGFAL